MGRASTDAELIAASRRGDATAFGEIVERYQRAVIAVSYSGTRDRTLSEDVAQDTFVTAWRQLAALREIDRLPAWLCGIARNLARAARRRHGRETALDDHDLVSEYGPFDAVSDQQAEQVVASALARVPATYREPLVLFYCEHQSVKSVAQALGISEDATHQRLSRGRQHLADGVSGLVERTLERQRPRRDLAAAVLAAIAMVGVSSQVDASTTSTRGSTMLKTKIGAALGVTAAIVGTGYVVQRSGAEPAPPHISLAEGISLAEHGNTSRVAQMPVGIAPVSSASSGTAATGAKAPRAPAGVGAPLACNTIARHIADLGMQAQPDIAQLTPEQIELDIQKISSQVDEACSTQNWSMDYRACIAAASETFTIGVECARFAPPDGIRPPTTAQPQAPYTGNDMSCAAVGNHVVSLMQPDPATLENLDPEARQRRVDAIKRARSTMPDQVEAACDQGAWSEARRRCMLGATTMSDADKCR
ncbi:MAG: sigM [Rhizobium sp.]|nr:sigM [Rhizobium sp.]